MKNTQAHPKNKIIKEKFNTNLRIMFSVIPYLVQDFIRLEKSKHYMHSRNEKDKHYRNLSPWKHLD